jgi:alkanesulfonate monooxygenase SsuD/methylene tetrahydromethanopterin reductase-like flavin-dependent oxidoreductase (luciferase family)
MMPSHPPERGIRAGIDYDLAQLRLLDSLGFREAWIGEHFTAPWEPCPAPDLLIAQALRETERIVLAPGAHLLPYHHPIELAHRVAYLDHMARGRYMLGIGISALPGDLLLYDMDAEGGENRRRTLESLDIMLRLWREGAFDFEGEFWNVRRLDTAAGRPSWLDFLDVHLKPYQSPHPPIGIAGLSAGSKTLELAGERGFLPLSISLNPAHTGSHWDSVLRGAERTGRTPDRREWRLVREVYIAETDAKAREYARNGAMGRCWGEYLLPFYVGAGMGAHFKSDPSQPDSMLDVDYLVDRNWLVGSPATVTEKLQQLQHDTGGFGTLLVVLYDFSGEQERWEASLRMLVEEVAPKVLGPERSA